MHVLSEGALSTGEVFDEQARVPSALAARRSFTITRWYALVALGLFVFLWAYFIYLLEGTIVDDAYITLTYARNLASGAGLVFTDGVRIEGYTDFLWVLLGAGAFSAGIDPIWAYRIVGLLSGVVLMAAVWQWNEQFSITPPQWRVAPVILAATGPVAYWSVAGLETTTFTSLVFGATLAATARGRYAATSGVLCFLAALARPDAVIFVLTIGGYLILHRRGQRHWTEPFRFLAAFTLPFAAYWISRWIYFGDLMPNTFYAKASFSVLNLRYALFDYILPLGPPAVFLTPLLIAFAFVKGLRRKPESNLLLAQVCLWLVYVFYVGGDFLEMWRFLVPAFPAVALLLQEASWITISTSTRKVLPGLVSGLVVVSLMLSWVAEVGVARSYTSLRKELRQMGEWFERNSNPGDVIAVSSAGAIPYFSQRPALDMLGLNNRHIAHNGHVDHGAIPAHKRYDAAYVLEQAPTYIVLNTIKEAGQPLTDRTLVSNDALLREPRFRKEYARVRLLGISSPAVVFVRNDSVDVLVGRGLIALVGQSATDSSK